MISRTLNNSIIFNIISFLLSLVLALSCNNHIEPENPVNNTGEGETTSESIQLSFSSDDEWKSEDVIGLRIPEIKIFNQPLPYLSNGFKYELGEKEGNFNLFVYYPYSEILADGKFSFEINNEYSELDIIKPIKVASISDVKFDGEAKSLKLDFKELLSTIKIKLHDATSGGKMSGKKISVVNIKSDNAICGIYVADVDNASVSIAKGKNELSFRPTDLMFGSSEHDFSFSILPGTYKFEISVITESTDQVISEQFTVTAGQTKAIDFAYTVDKQPYKGITSADDWNRFIAALILGNYNKYINPETGEVDLNADIQSDEDFAYPATEENPNIEFDGILNGNGHSITCPAFTRPLFNIIAKNAVVKNLNIKGEFTNMANPGQCGNATIAKQNFGTISGCNNYVNTNYTSKTGVICGCIVAQNAGLIENCKNYGNVVINSAMIANGGFYGGGIAAIGHSVIADNGTNINVDESCIAGTFIGCENRGKLEFYTVKSGSSESAAPIKSGFGGICGLVYLDGVEFRNCNNFSDIVRLDNGAKSSNFFSAVGGILGRSAATAVKYNTAGAVDAEANTNGYNTILENCSNTGKILNQCRHSGMLANDDTGARKDGTGGIVGIIVGKDTDARIISCTNTGEILAGWGNVNSAVVGGIAGVANKTIISKSVSNARLASPSSAHPLGACGGIVGMSLNNVVIDACESVNQISIYQVNGKTICWGLCCGYIRTSLTGANISSKSGNTVVGGIVVINDQSQPIDQNNYKSFLSSSSPGYSIEGGENTTFKSL